MDPKAAYRKPNPNGIIYKLQGCLGIQAPDSFFGTNTEKLLFDKTNKNTITKDEINTLCGTKSVTPDNTQATTDDTIPTLNTKSSIEAFNTITR